MASFCFSMIFIGHSFSANVLLSDFCVRWALFFTCIEIYDIVTVYLFIIIVTHTLIITSYFTKVAPETSFFSKIYFLIYFIFGCTRKRRLSLVAVKRLLFVAEQGL